MSYRVNQTIPELLIGFDLVFKAYAIAQYLTFSSNLLNESRFNTSTLREYILVKASIVVGIENDLSFFYCIGRNIF